MALSYNQIVLVTFSGSQPSRTGGLASGNAPGEKGGTKQGLMTREEGVSRSTVKKRDRRDWLWGERTLQNEH